MEISSKKTVGQDRLLHVVIIPTDKDTTNKTLFNIKYP